MAVRCILLSRLLAPLHRPRSSIRICQFYSTDKKSEDAAPDKSEKEDPLTAEKDPEEPTTCCMSGCANCVWIEYAEVMAARYRDGGHKAREAIKNIKDPMMKAFLTMELKSIGEKSS